MPAVQAQAYATVQDLMECGIPARALDRIPPAVITRALLQASRVADTELSSRYSLPLKTWGADLTQIVCSIAAYKLLTWRGWDPDDPNSKGVTMLYGEAKSTLKSVAAGDMNLDVVDTGPEPALEPDINTAPLRGF